jgi:hypothetical protein
MRILGKLALVSLVLSSAFWVGNVSIAQDTCNYGPNHTIQVRPDGAGGVELTYRGGSGESVQVCVGDTVSWVLTGSDRTFFVDFFDGVPFDGPGRRPNNSRLTVTIEAEPGDYDYDVGWDGEPGRDPKLVVSR